MKAERKGERTGCESSIRVPYLTGRNLHAVVDLSVTWHMLVSGVGVIVVVVAWL